MQDLRRVLWESRIDDTDEAARAASTKEILGLEEQIRLRLAVTAGGYPATSKPATTSTTPADNSDHSVAAGEPILFLGDGITSDGRFVRNVQAYYLLHPADARRTYCINLGVEGDTVSPIPMKIGSDRETTHQVSLDWIAKAVYEIGPRTVVICYGMGDGRLAATYGATIRCLS